MTKNEITLLAKLYDRLYGDKEFEGDIPEIKQHLKDLNGSVLRNTIRSVQNEKALRVLIWAVGGVVIILGAIIGVVALV